MEVVEEAVKHIPQEMREKYPQIPWHEMAGMRDKLIHFYFGIDYYPVWRAVTNRVPEIKRKIQQIL